jgi:hypothetical protein
MNRIWLELDAMGAQCRLDLAHHEPVRPVSPSMLRQGLDQLAHMIGQDVLPTGNMPFERALLMTMKVRDGITF